ncbi:hypothetical protein GGQ74_001310 [Desulfobaculum xiamenense]|uniref:Uncharacterized protein n=1 Tax=Desulfobaculum xiamenense TaxID=995050 RepID=A0A846QKU3_9BACT|nr:hypothetical protein [Desulfobaculum xiamenense]NJB67670.1 hypothetical protein [Desulfobaculum xiamenense]
MELKSGRTCEDAGAFIGRSGIFAWAAGLRIEEAAWLGDRAACIKEEKAATLQTAFGEY